MIALPPKHIDLSKRDLTMEIVVHGPTWGFMNWRTNLGAIFIKIAQKIYGVPISIVIGVREGWPK